MKNLKISRILTLKRITALAAAAAVILTFASCTGVDPNVKQKESTASSYKVETAPNETQAESEGFNAYGDGLTDPVKLKGVKISVKDYAIRSYELAFLLGTGSFKNPSKLPIDLLTQYGFSHLYYKNLYEIPKNQLMACEAQESDIKKMLNIYFGEMKLDLKKSTLYNKGDEKFELWLPEYGTNVYYRVDAADVSKNKVKIIVTFFNEFKKSSKLGRTTMTVKLKKGKPVISELKVG